jgi:hypothetical protein
MTTIADRFNCTAFSRFINSGAGRVFRLVAGAGFLALGIVFREHPLGLFAIAWSVLPLSSAACDLCYVSALLGGPLTGERIRAQQQSLPLRTA